MNNVNLVGRLCAEPELRRTGDGTAVCSFSLAVKRPMVKDATDFPECASWRQSAEFLAKYGHKGDIVAVSGTLQSRKWTDKEGKQKTSWEVVATSVELLSSRRKNEESGNTSQGANIDPGAPGRASGQYGQQSYGGYQQQGFGGYHAPQQNDYPQLDGDDPKLPF